MRTTIVWLCALSSTSALAAQQRLPIIDMHVHALAADGNGPPPLAMCTPIDPMPAWDQTGRFSEVFLEALKSDPPCEDPVWSPMTEAEIMSRTLEIMERRNIIGVVSGTPARVGTWRATGGERVIPGLIFNLAQPRNFVTVDSLGALLESGAVEVFGEISNQYNGIAPDDERMEAYWSLAEQRGVPVGIHLGPGPIGAPYVAYPRYRAALHSPLSVEDVLVRHPRLRIYLMHAGYPMLDDLLAVLYVHPQVYVDVGVIVYTQPRPAFYRFLRGIVEAGFGDRVMFGSDQMVWPETIERGIRVIEEAPFLSEAQKRDILYNNAARFLRLSAEEIARHHAM